MSADKLDRDTSFMRRALDEARQSMPSPNPPVGAVVTRPDGQLVAVGHHEAAGGPHAEVAALSSAGDEARSGTLYVTLEPCNHSGRTPPCTDAIMRAGIARVVVGCLDPNPHVDGGGVDRLRQAGLDVTIGVCEEEARALILPWTTFITSGVPH
ncbi:MAG: bifunctional diaminohydroxyphosphoribosylaminopyrimidine deaminase/5-amino-6-(5-phosphoribosylamino)uracil reductase RibD, partial [Polyangiaceae bacterium]